MFGALTGESLLPKLYLLGTQSVAKMGPVPFSAEDPCPRAKLLAGNYQCPCHGLHSSTVQASQRAERKPFRAARTRVQRPLSTPEDQESCRALYAEGATIAALASQYRCGLLRVRSVLGDAVRANNRRVEICEDDRVEIRRRHSEGEPVAHIAKAFGRDRWTIYSILGVKKGTPKDALPICPGSLDTAEGTLRCVLRRRSHPKIAHTGPWTESPAGPIRIQWGSEQEVQ